ncbi:MAG: VOC family protein [Solirubrobacterales bacterium]
MTALPPRTGLIKWADLTVDNAEDVRDFYAGVVGWNAIGLPVGDREDFIMAHPETGDPAAGICHQAGDIEGLPQQWLVYVTVDDLDDSIAACDQLGGKVVFGPRASETMGRWCVVEDPAGAVMALTELTPGEDN